MLSVKRLVDLQLLGRPGQARKPGHFMASEETGGLHLCLGKPGGKGMQRDERRAEQSEPARRIDCGNGGLAACMGKSFSLDPMRGSVGGDKLRKSGLSAGLEKVETPSAERRGQQSKMRLRWEEGKRGRQSFQSPHCSWGG